MHERNWLSSPFTSAAGTAAREFCETFGLQQLVDRPTHKNAILDLVMTNILEVLRIIPIWAAVITLVC